MKITERLIAAMPEALRAGDKGDNTHVSIMPDGKGAVIRGYVDFEKLAAELATRAGIAEMAMIPMFDMGTWNGDPSARPKGFMSVMAAKSEG